MTPDLILASTSRYRAALLQRFGLPFRTLPPEVPELRRPDESPSALATRLAEAKAAAVAARHPDAWVIGSDQVAELGGEPLGKPGSVTAANDQLRRCRGRAVDFHTAVCLIRARDGIGLHHLDLTRVELRKLDDLCIARYLAREPAVDCAGSFKVEGLGITLFERVRSEDPTALEGLPLIALARMLRQAGLELP